MQSHTPYPIKGSPAYGSGWPYYGKWAASMATLLLERGILKEEELEEAMGGGGERSGWEGGVSEGGVTQQPLFRAGDAVRVLPDALSPSRWRRPHLRVPGYLFGAVGEVERAVGFFDDPEFLAFRKQAPPQPLYRVRVTTEALGWGGEEGGEGGTVDVEVYGSWLESASRSELDAANAASSYAHTHTSPLSPSTLPETAAERLSEALVSALTRNGTVTAADLHRATSRVEELAHPSFSSGPDAVGPRLVAKAWRDEGFRRALLEDAQGALAVQMGVDATNATAPTKLIVVPNSPDTHNLIGGGRREGLEDAVRTPRALLAEFGTMLPESTKIRVHDSTADCRYLVLPMQPAGTEDHTEEQLAGLVTRDSMIGVALPKSSLSDN
ncbi:MAG: hypothetical protein SGPRY_010886 [Prymnesium sp.]